jgi:hypothetical protein
MAYQKHGTGPNDYKKGNRTRGKDRKGDTTAIVAATKEYEGNIERYKAFAEARRKAIKYGQEFAYTLMNNLTAYIEECQRTNEPITNGGLIMASGVGKDTYYKMREGEYDYRLYEYMDVNGITWDMADSSSGYPVYYSDSGPVVLLPFAELIEKSELVLQAQREKACSSLRGNPAGNIFLLKAQQGFRDDSEVNRGTVNNNLVLNNVATLEEARDALKRLNRG